MLVGQILSVLGGLIMLFSFVPYARDILKDKVKPSRSARLMMVLLIFVSLFQQKSLGSGWLLAMTVGDGIGAVGILLLALKKGVGGLSKIDIACYLLLGMDIALWLTTGNALLAIHLGIIADLVAMTPVFFKTWQQPWTETPLFFILGIVAPLISILGVGRYSYAIILFPAYIAAVNIFETGLILYRQRLVDRPQDCTVQTSQPLI